METKLQVLIVTIASRLAQINIDNYPQVAGVGYVLSIQNPDSKPVEMPAAIARRTDVQTFVHNDSGVSRNRNHALSHATASLALVADDDLCYTPEQLKYVMTTYESHPELDFVMWRAKCSGTRIYPPNDTCLSYWPKNYNPLNIEFSFRVSSIRRYQIAWNELVGINSPCFVAGEEELFFRDMLRHRLCGVFKDYIVTEHMGSTTSQRWAQDSKFISGKGAVIRACRGAFPALIRLPLEAKRAHAPYFKALRWLFEGYLYATKHHL